MASIISYTKTKIDQLLGLKANVADAVPLAGSGDLPALLGPAAFQGSANVAARSDHIHKVVAPYGYPIPEPTWATGAMWGHPLGKGGSQTMDNNKCPAAPFPVPQAFTLKTIVINLGQAADGGTYAFAIYASGTNGYPLGDPIWTSADQTGTSTGVKSLGSLTVALASGKFWLAMGAKGYTTNRPLPKLAETYHSELLPVGTDATWQPGAFLSDFNETTGAWPTLAAPPNLSTSNSNSGFWFAIQGTPA